MGFGNVPGQGSSLSAIQIRDALQTLTGANRLDASAIKNIGAVTPTSADPLFADVVLLLPLTTSSGLVDIKGKSVTNAGSTLSTAVNDPFGDNTGVRAFASGGARISVAQSADFAFENGAFAIDGWLYPTAFPSGIEWGIMDCRAGVVATPWTITGTNTGQLSMYNEFNSSTNPLLLNQWNYFCISRPLNTGFSQIWLNGAGAVAASARSNIPADGNLLIGDILNTGSDYGGSFTGYMSNVRITRAYRDGSIVPTAPFPTS
jgi:hypothetical protein